VPGREMGRQLFIDFPAEHGRDNDKNEIHRRERVFDIMEERHFGREDITGEECLVFPVALRLLIHLFFSDPESSFDF
jgi:hypothetical protein